MAGIASAGVSTTLPLADLRNLTRDEKRSEIQWYCSSYSKFHQTYPSQNIVGISNIYGEYFEKYAKILIEAGRIHYPISQVIEPSVHYAGTLKSDVINKKASLFNGDQKREACLEVRAP